MVSLPVELHNIVVGYPAHWADLAAAGTFDASSHVAAGYEGGITLDLIAEFTHFRRAVEARNLLLAWLLRSDDLRVVLLLYLPLFLLFVEKQLVRLALRHLADTRSDSDWDTAAYDALTITVVLDDWPPCR